MIAGHSARIAKDLNLTQASVEAALSLLGEGCTVPFIARYRKEATGSLDEEEILAVKTLSERLEALESSDRTDMFVVIAGIGPPSIR